jgi:hypothetical protein
MALASKHGHGVVENVRASLDTLVEPAGAVFVLVNGDAVGLTAAVVDCINDCNIEFVRVLGQVVGAGHA